MTPLLLPVAGSSTYASLGLSLMCYGGVIGVVQAVAVALMLYALASLGLSLNGELPLLGYVVLATQAVTLSS